MPSDAIYIPEDERRTTREEALLLAAILAMLGGVISEVRGMFGLLRRSLRRNTDLALAEDAVRFFQSDATTLAGELNGMSLDVINQHLRTPGGASVGAVAAPVALQRQTFISQQVNNIAQRAINGARLVQTPGVPPGAILDSLISGRDEISVIRAFDTGTLHIASANTLSSGRGIFSTKLAVPEIDQETTDLCRNRMGWQLRALEEPFVDTKTGAAWMTPPFIFNGLPAKEEYHACRTVMLLR